LFVEATDIGKRHSTIFFSSLHVKDGGINLSWQDAHNRQGGHIQGHSSTRLQIVVIQPRSASHHIARTTGGLDNEAFRVQSFQDIPNDLAHTLKGSQVILGLLVSFAKTLDVLSHALQASLDFAMLANFGTVIIQNLLSFRSFAFLLCLDDGCWSGSILLGVVVVVVTHYLVKQKWMILISTLDSFERMIKTTRC
jgi:hypothetical protein